MKHATLQITLRASSKLQSLLFLILLGALICIWTSSMPWWGYVLSMGGWFYGLYSLFGLRSSQTIIRCKTTAEGKWHLYQNNGERLIGLLDGQTYMCHFFLILVFKISAPRKASRHIMIFRDSIDAAEWRHLMRYLFVWRIKIGKK